MSKTETEVKKPASKSAQIRKLHAEGKSTSEISKSLNLRYQFVHQVVAKMKNEQELAELRKLNGKQ